MSEHNAGAQKLLLTPAIKAALARYMTAEGQEMLKESEQLYFFETEEEGGL